MTKTRTRSVITRKPHQCAYCHSGILPHTEATLYEYFGHTDDFGDDTSRVDFFKIRYYLHNECLRNQLEEDKRYREYQENGDEYLYERRMKGK